MNKRTAIAIWGVISGIIGVGIWVFVETGWPLARFKGGVSIPETATLRTSVEADPLDPRQALELRELFERLLSSEKEIYTKPDVIIWVQNEDEEDKQLSIWISEGFVYDGHFLDAWTERMSGDESKGFRLSRSAAEFLKTIE